LSKLPSVGLGRSSPGPERFGPLDGKHCQPAGQRPCLPKEIAAMDLGTLLNTTTPALTDLAILVMRVFIGVCFVTHGLGKLGVVGTGDMQGFVGWLESMNVPLAPIQARMAMLSEIVGGTALVLGLLTRPACLLLIGTMVVAARLGHKGAGYLITNEPPGAEYTVNLAAVCFVIALLGPGLFSIDRLLF
jgi:putative oxidoreductase